MPRTKLHSTIFLPALTLLTAVTLVSCEDSENTLGSSTPVIPDDTTEITVVTETSTGNLSSANVPPELISNMDSSSTLQAVRAGIDLYGTLIDTSFSCYNKTTIDTSQPYTTLTVSGNYYVSELGNGQIDYDIQYGDFTLDGGPFDGNDNVYLNFDKHGQSFYVEVGNREYACFQHGASLERGFHRFLLNTPEHGEYSCRHVDSTDQRSVRLSSGGRYDTSQGSGKYQYGDIIDGGGSIIEFTDGPLAGQTASYKENSITGRQEFRVSATQNFGILAGSSSSLTYVCGRLRTPRPFKHYGYAAATPVSVPDVSLSGLFFSPDITISVNDSHQYADYYHFRVDGYMLFSHPSAVGDDCDRTQPNGLNYCLSYNVENGLLKVYDRAGRALRDRAIKLANNGTPIEISHDSVEDVTPSPTTHISGIWMNNKYTSSGCVGGGYCSYSYSERVYRFEKDGRFIRDYSSQLGSTLSTAVASSSAFGSSSNDSTGYYEIQGNRLILKYDNGDLRNQFIFQSKSGRLAIDGLSYGVSTGG